MLNKKLTIPIWTFLILCLTVSIGYAQPPPNGEELGETIQIYTYLDSFVGKPSWLLIIRDLDHGINWPYLFDIQQGDNFWVAYTHSKNYVISASTLQIETYRSRFNKYRNFRIHNFCHLESECRIIRGESVYVTLYGNLSPNTDRFSCHVHKYPDTTFTIVPHNPEE